MRVAVFALLLVLTGSLHASSVCVQDLACAAVDSEVLEASRAIALLRVVRGERSHVCTGALVHDTAHSGTAWLITARHCVATQEEAESIEAVWDDRAAFCGSTEPRSRIRTWGADLIASSAATDIALLRMRRLPPGRTFLEVERMPLPAGTATYRISHAEGGTQKYSASFVTLDGAGCASAPRPEFVYSTPSSGGVALGSSGAPLLLPGLRIAGALTGLCGPATSDACAVGNDLVDGSIAAAWEVVGEYLDAPVVAKRRAARH